MDFVLVFGCALAAGSLATVAPWVVAITATSITLLAPKRMGVAFACALGITLGWCRAHAQIDAFTAVRVKGRCTGRAHVISSPVLVHGVLRWDANVLDADCEGVKIAPFGARLYGGPADLARGDVVEIVSQLAPIERYANPDLGAVAPRLARSGASASGSILDANVLERGRGPPAWIDRARAHVRARILATFPSDVEPLARALVLGETDLAEDEDNAFRASGLSHLLAVSGTHLVVTVVALVSLLRAFLVRIESLARARDVGRIAAAIGIPLAWTYASFAGASGSAVRAAWMLSAALLARVFDRHPSASRALGLSLVFGVLSDPLAAFDVSFVLSAASTAGLVVFGRPLAEAISKDAPRIVRVVWTTCAASIAATIACAPILATMTSSLPIGGVISNVVAVPIGELAALPLCLLHACLSFWPSAERGCALAASGSLSLLSRIAHVFGDASWACINVPSPTNAQLGVMAFGVGAFVLARDRTRVTSIALAICALLVFEISAIHAGAPKNVLRATMLDVGQGDASIVDLPDGTMMIVDGGGAVGSPVDIGTRVLAPVLRMRRRDEARIVVLSHPHPDHFGGFVRGLSSIDVRAFWDTGQGEREGTTGGYSEVLAHMRERQVPVMRPDVLCGRHPIGGAIVDVFAPCPAIDSARSPNDNSFVMRITYGSRAFLFVGDAEHEEESDLSSSDLHADVLKVGHHGSRTSTTRSFLAAVRPSVAIISCGVRNRFGHPAPETLETLSSLALYRTDLDGAITVETDGTSLDIQKGGAMPP